MSFILRLLLAASIQVPSDSIVWNAAPPSMPAGTNIAILEGDPKKAGLFTIRLRVPAGAAIAPHWHPRPERVTVLSGRVSVGFGETADRTSTTAFDAGSFYVNAPGSRHYLFFDEESVLQLTCEGPWELHFVKN